MKSIAYKNCSFKAILFIAYKNCSFKALKSIAIARGLKAIYSKYFSDLLLNLLLPLNKQGLKPYTVKL